jgi:hypothetical protein
MQQKASRATKVRSLAWLKIGKKRVNNCSRNFVENDAVRQKSVANNILADRNLENPIFLATNFKNQKMKLILIF